MYNNDKDEKMLISMAVVATPAVSATAVSMFEQFVEDNHLNI